MHVRNSDYWTQKFSSKNLRIDPGDHDYFYNIKGFCDIFGKSPKNYFDPFLRLINMAKNVVLVAINQVLKELETSSKLKMKDEDFTS